mgnify:CR=1 FL=1
MSNTLRRVLLGSASLGLIAGTLIAVPMSAQAAPNCTPGPKAHCKGADLRGLDLHGVNLSGADLRNAKLHRANLKKANLKGANLKGAILKSANLNYANMIGANLKGTNHAGASMIGTKLANATFDADEQLMHVLPDEGQTIGESIASAQHSVDIVIYEIGGPNIVGQPGSPGALMNAVSNGINVRVMLNGQWQNTACTATTSQSVCAESTKLDAFYATQESLQYAQQHPATGKTAGSFSINFANNNFNITHQKTIIIDAADANGQPIAASALPTSSIALVSTGNLQSYGWGYKNTSNPLQACGSNCPQEWAARDFYMTLTDHTLINEIENVFYSDLYCGAQAPSTTPSRTWTNDLLNTPLPLTWSNGATTDTSTTPASYPSVATGYPYPVTNSQGNAKPRILNLINSAKSTVMVYNEEMSDKDIISALTSAAKRLGPHKVQVIMTLSDSWFGAWATLDAAGVDVRVTQVDDASQYSEQLYMHGKAFIADSTDAFFGSENAGSASLTENRELGLMLTNRANAGQAWVQSIQGISTLTTTFTNDWNTPGYLQWDITQKTSATLRAIAHANRIAHEKAMRSSYTYSFPMLCGPMPARSAS